MGLLAVDVSAFGVVMSAESQPIEALGGQTRGLSQQGGLTRCTSVIRSEGGFVGFRDTSERRRSMGARPEIG